MTGHPVHDLSGIGPGPVIAGTVPVGDGLDRHLLAVPAQVRGGDQDLAREDKGISGIGAQRDLAQELSRVEPEARLVVSDSWPRSPVRWVGKVFRLQRKNRNYLLKLNTSATDCCQGIPAVRTREGSPGFSPKHAEGQAGTVPAPLSARHGGEIVTGVAGRRERYRKVYLEKITLPSFAKTGNLIMNLSNK